MATGNFYFKNRCIVVTNDDYEFDNLPKLGSYVSRYSLHSHDARLLEHDENFDYFDIVLVNGYYQDACIDYRETDFTITDLIGSSYYYLYCNEVFAETQKQIKISNYRLRKCFGRLKDFDTFEHYFNAGIENLDEWLKNEEEKCVNKYLDKLKKEHGYEEYGVSAVFSNGETIYSKVG